TAAEKLDHDSIAFHWMVAQLKSLAFRMGKTIPAVDALVPMVKETIPDPDYHYRLAGAYALGGDVAAAQREFKIAQPNGPSEDSGEGIYYWEIIHGYIKSGHEEEVIALAERKRVSGHADFVYAHMLQAQVDLDQLSAAEQSLKLIHNDSLRRQAVRTVANA